MEIVIVGILGMMCAAWIGAMILGVVWRKDREYLDRLWEKWKKEGKV